MTPPRTLAVVQARLSSSRLPGKVLMPLHGMPMILFMLARVRRTTRIDEIVLATSTDASDDPLADAVAAAGYTVHRGPLDDVLARFVGAVEPRAADWVVRLTGDCPLIDPAIVDRVISQAQSERLDYCTNADPASFPDGLDVEVCTRAALLASATDARLQSEREHVTLFIRNHPERFRLNHLRAVADLSALRWTVDHADDLALVQALVAAIAARGGDPLQADLFDLLRVVSEQPQLAHANLHQRNEGLLKSLQADTPIS
ncbi:cytidylyltransferase domain-containing protein [Roseateles cellulosilyticus]|uniref:Glycosyltransferase family protein n=1 Tax=Pelomonas cellulosilytica TaxID=2906762 RepID=A0ABS8XZB0_9BURK|nr:glycosyltransferase family protein [Pelomonas sp. P8]MCE4556111.1 glycosyltransferase family protein [Pelomonas sp. P8]